MAVAEQSTQVTEQTAYQEKLAARSSGRIIQITGPVVDVQFEERIIPPIYQALRVLSDGVNNSSPLNVVLEVQQHLGEGRVRCVAMEPTEGMVRGMKVVDSGGPITVRWVAEPWDES